MKDDGAHFISGGQVHCGHRADALTVQDYVFRRNAILRPQEGPRRVDVGVEVLLGGLPAAGAVAGVVVAEDVAVDARSCGGDVRRQKI